MSDPKIYAEFSRWFYETIRPSYKGSTNPNSVSPYSGTLKTGYNNVVGYRISQQALHTYSAPSYITPTTSKSTYFPQSTTSYRSSFYS